MARVCQRRREGRGIAIELLPIGSLEGRKPCWLETSASPSGRLPSSPYQESFVEEWQAKHNEPPIAREESLVLTADGFLS